MERGNREEITWTNTLALTITLHPGLLNDEFDKENSNSNMALSMWIPYIKIKSPENNRRKKTNNKPYSSIVTSGRVNIVEFNLIFMFRNEDKPGIACDASQTK